MTPHLVCCWGCAAGLHFSSRPIYIQLRGAATQARELVPID